MTTGLAALRARGEACLETAGATAADWFDVGLLAKADHDWQACAQLNMEALRRHDASPGDPAAWNAGIAYTALGEWRRAREMWSAYGIDMPINDDPIHDSYGWTPVRLNPDGPSLDYARPPIVDGLHASTVWIFRHSPAHGRIVSVPMPETRHRYGDVILHDGVPSGERVIDGRTVSVFDELAVLDPSNLPTWQVTVSCDGNALDRLGQRCADADIGMDDWSAIRVLCRACSMGNPDAGHAHPPPQEERTRLGMGGTEADLRAVLASWGGVDSIIHDVELVWDVESPSDL